jgi:hypothetical protein
MARFLQTLHAGRASASRRITLREDFAGTAGVCRAWLALDEHHRAVAVDADAEPLRRARKITRLRAVTADVRRCHARADIISATNFPIGYWHTRSELVRYCRATRRRLNPRGVFVCDTYGGPSAFTPGVRVRRLVPVPSGSLGDLGPRLARSTKVSIRQTWEQRAADPITGLVSDVLHFEILRGRRVVRRYADAFVYRWRLWSVPELTDALLEAGFRRIDVYDRLADAIDHTGRTHVRPMSADEAPTGDYVVWLAAR